MLAACPHNVTALLEGDRDVVSKAALRKAFCEIQSEMFANRTHTLLLGRKVGNEAVNKLKR